MTLRWGPRRERTDREPCKTTARPCPPSPCLWCVSRPAPTTSARRRSPGRPAHPCYRSPSASSPVPKRRRSDWPGKPRRPAWRNGPKPRKLCRERKRQTENTQIQITQRLKTLPPQTPIIQRSQENLRNLGS